MKKNASRIIAITLVLMMALALIPLGAHAQAFTITFEPNGGEGAAYVAEIVRGGILSVDRGQTEAGRSLGFSGYATMMNIILPQAAKSALPALCNEFIALIKETSILSYIALTELTKAGDYIRSRTYSAFTPYIISGLLYLLVTLVLTRLIGRLERRLLNSER